MLRNDIDDVKDYVMVEFRIRESVKFLKIENPNADSDTPNRVKSEFHQL